MAAKETRPTWEIGDVRFVPSKRGGFTLLELMVVLVLIAALSGVIFAEMRGTMEEAHLRSAARKLIDGANLANARAVSLNEPHLLTIEVAQRRFTVHRNVRDEEEGLRQVTELSGADGAIDERISIRLETADESLPEEQQEPPDEDRERAQPHVIRFYPDGTADPAEIVLRDRLDGELRLRMSTSTSRLRIVESAEE